MAWIRLSDDYNDHPKFIHLSDGAFRLWHQGMGFCRKFQTDGSIPMMTVRSFTAYSVKRMKELLTPWRVGEYALWNEEPGGVKVHDYLEWNASKDEENERRVEHRDRMRSLRERRASSRSAPSVTSPVRTNITQTSNVSARAVPGWEGIGSSSSENGSGEKPSAEIIAERAGALLNRYAELYAKHRHGAKLRLLHNRLEFDDACSLCEQWDDERLDKLAAVVLTTDEEFIAKTDRGFKIFALKASWADDRLCQWAREKGVAL